MKSSKFERFTPSGSKDIARREICGTEIHLNLSKLVQLVYLKMWLKYLFWIRSCSADTAVKTNIIKQAISLLKANILKIPLFKPK